MIPTIMGVLFIFLGFGVGAVGLFRYSFPAVPPPHQMGRFKISCRRATASTQTKPLTIVPKERENG